MSLSGFETAQQLQSKLKTQIDLPQSMRDILSNTISSFETGCINLIQSNSIAEINKEIHKLLVHAVTDDWSVSMIDTANCFNPQLISNYAFENDLHGMLILKQISLSRPFQYYQSISIIKDLVRNIENSDTDEKHLIVITNLTQTFFDPSVEQEDPEFPVPQLQALTNCIGLLQSLAVQGHTILITDRIGKHKSFSTMKEFAEIFPASLRYAANLHIKIQEDDDFKMTKLLSHPFLPSKTVREKIPTKEEMRKSKKSTQSKWQKSLDEFF